MIRAGKSLRSERGMAMVIALLIMLVITFLGISSVSTSVFEAQITGNDRVGADAFFAAEAGVQVALNQIPVTNPVPRTKVGEDSYCWTGTPQDKSTPKSIESLGRLQKSGYESHWSFRRFQVNATGESFGAAKEVEVQVSFGPFPAGTHYNN